MNNFEIESISSEAFKNMWNTKGKEFVFHYLEEKKNTYKLVKHIKYNTFEMASYLKEGDVKLSVQERQYLYQCRVIDNDLRAHRTWKFEETFCISCQDTNQTENISHILACTFLVNQNEKITYLPSQQDLYSDDISEQSYTRNIIRENMHIQEELKKKRLLAHWQDCYVLVVKVVDKYIYTYRRDILDVLWKILTFFWKTFTNMNYLNFI